MDDEAARIIAESYATLERLREREQNPPHKNAEGSGGHFDPVRARQMRKAAEPDDDDLRFSEAIVTRSAPAADWWNAIDARINAAIESERAFIVEAVGRALGESLESSERTQSRALHCELAALRAEIAKMESLLEVLRAASEHERSKVLDLPPLPSRRDMN